MRWINWVFLISLISGCASYHYDPVESGRTKLRSSVTRLDTNGSADTLDLRHFPLIKRLAFVGESHQSIATFFRRNPVCSEIEVILLDGLGLFELPKELVGYPNLVHLSLRGNPQMDWVQAEGVIGELFQLQFLNLASNELYAVPKLSNLPTLVALNLSNNNLGSGEDYSELLNIQELKSIWLDNNQIVTFPQEVCRLSNLRYLYLNHNALVSLPDAMHNMDRLWVLYLAHNDFKELPEKIIEIPNLKMLVIHDNPIEYVSPRFRKRRKYSMRALIMNNHSLGLDDSARMNVYFKRFMRFEM